MLVFALGISMVVGITFTMQNLSESVFETSAEVALDKILDKIRETLINGVNNAQFWNGISTYEHDIDLTSLLINKYSYEINITIISGTYFLLGKTSTANTDILRSSSLLFTTNDVLIQGTILSTGSNPYLLFEKNINSILTVTLGNK
jgi:hypothetical protein